MLTQQLKCEIIVFQIEENKLIITQAVTTGISDFFFKNSRKDRRNVPPLWMTDEEKAEWYLGQRIAKETLWVR